MNVRSRLPAFSRNLLLSLVLAGCGGMESAPAIENAPAAAQEGTVVADLRDAERFSRYILLSSKELNATIPINPSTLVAISPFGCFGGEVSLRWAGAQELGVLRHEARLDARDLNDCSDADLQPVRQEAANHGGWAAGKVTVELMESIQFLPKTGCVRGLYETLTVRFPSSPQRSFGSHVYRELQTLTESQCEALISAVDSKP